LAGNYPDTPSWRMAYDRDGSVAVRIGATGTLTQLTQSEMIALNDEDGLDQFVLSDISETTATAMLAVCFPEPRDIDGYYIHVGRGTAGGFQTATYWVDVSPNTTNGQDGDWIEVAGPFDVPAEFPPVKPAYRRDIVSETSFGMRGIRFRVFKELNTEIRVPVLHLYGEAAPGANPNRLELWHPTADEKLPPAWLDWGDVPRTSSADRQFRVKNLSPSLTANDVRVAMDVLTDALPSVPGQHTLSVGGGAFLSQVNAAMGLWSFRLFAESNDWT
jgi:hypothetical protein